ncbi:MAG: hypothetical protein NVS3B12_07410 [Acidimicrobiales bacterium]
MKKLIATAFGAAMLAAPLVGMTAAHADAPSTNKNACFGDGRSDYAQTAPGAVGAAASSRGGSNSTQNAAYKESCGA